MKKLLFLRFYVCSGLVTIHWTLGNSVQCSTLTILESQIIQFVLRTGLQIIHHMSQSYFTSHTLIVSVTLHCNSRPRARTVVLTYSVMEWMMVEVRSITIINNQQMWISIRIQEQHWQQQQRTCSCCQSVSHSGSILPRQVVEVDASNLFAINRDRHRDIGKM